MSQNPTQDPTQAVSQPVAPTPSGQLPPQPPPAAPNVPSQGPTQPRAAAPVVTAQPPKQSIHGKIFEHVLNTMSGGGQAPMKDANGQIMTNPDGSVKTKQMSKKGMAASIVAGALSSMAAGWAAGAPKYQGRGQGYRGGDPAAAFQAGQETGEQFSTQNKVNQAQKTSDDTRVRQYQTLKQNMDIHQQSLQVDRLGEEAQDRMLANAAPTVAQATTTTRPDGSSWFREDASRMNEQKTHEFMKANPDAVLNHSVIPVEKVPKLGDDGKPTGQYEMLYSAFKNDGMMTVTPEMESKYNLKGVTQVPIQMLMQRMVNANNADISEHSISDAVKQQNEFTGAKGKNAVTLDTKDLAKQFPNWAATLGKVPAGQAPDKFIAAVQGQDMQLGNYLQHTLGVDSEKWSQKRTSDIEALAIKKASDLQTAKDTINAESPKGQAELKHIQLENDTAQQNLTNNRIANASGLVGDAYLKTLPVGRASQIRGYGEGRLYMSDLPRGKEKTAIIDAVTQAYPDYDQSKGEVWKSTRNMYSGSGATAKKVINYNTALEHMQDLYKNSTWEGIMAPGSKAYSDRSVALNYVTRETGNAISSGVLTQQEGEEILSSLKGWTPTTAKERTAETARLLNDKIVEFQRMYQEAVPTQNMKAPTLLSPKAAAAYAYVQSGGSTPPPAQVGNVQVVDPNGTTRSFPNQAAADKFKKLAGMQ